MRWLDKIKPDNGREWPPRDWLTKKVTLAELESDDDGDDPPRVTAPTRDEAASIREIDDPPRVTAPTLPRPGDPVGELDRMKLRILAGDEI